MAEKTPIKEQIKALTENIEEGIQNLFQSGDLEKYQAYLRTVSRFHRYSVNNQMLIFAQCPHATLVAGYLFGADGRRFLHTADSGSGGYKGGDAALHIVGQEAAVGSRVGAELLFIERLEIVEGLLRGITEDAVGVALERGQVIECGRFLRLCLALHAFDRCCLALAGVGDSIGVLSVFHSVCRGGKAAIKLDGVKRFCHKRGDLRLTLHQQRQRGRHDAPDVQCAAIR